MRKLLLKQSHDVASGASGRPVGRFQQFLQDSPIWHYNRESVSRGVAAGLFAAFVPIMPFQTLLVVLATVLLRANLSVAFAVSWVSNPFTLLPMIYVIYRVGGLMLGDVHQQAAVQAITWNTESWQACWVSLHAWLLQFGKAFFVGLPIVSLTAGVLGYIAGNIFWHALQWVKARSKT